MLTLFLALLTLSTPELTDSLRTTDIEEIVVVSTPKESQRLRQQPLSSTSTAQAEMREQGIAGIKDLSAGVPNLFIPSYGSRLTTSVYIRGVGSRTGTPAVALYVDGVPQVSPASYDFNFSNIDRIDVLRGPQSTLYGRNSMGGVIRVFTKDPMRYQGTDIALEGSHTVGRAPMGRSDGDGVGRYRVNLTHYHRINERLAFSGHLFGEHDGGYFRNEARGDELIDSQTDLGARMRLIFKPKNDLKFDFTIGHEWLHQGGYPYEYSGVTGTPSTPDPQALIGHIAYDNRSGYRRNLTNAGLTTEKRWPRIVLTSVTGFQHLHDRMNLDQDFTDRNLYTLIQRQRANTFSEEIIVKKAPDQPQASPSLPGKGARGRGPHYSWLFGANILHQRTTTEGPVTFHGDGLEWLNGLINQQGNAHLPTVVSHDDSGNEAYQMNFLFHNEIQDSDLGFPGTYKTPTTNLALFHESTLQQLFGIEGLTLTAGLRLDYEHFALDHDAHFTFTQRYGLDGRLTYPDGSVREGMMLVPTRTFHVEEGLKGSLSKGYLKLLPRVTLQHAFSCGSDNTRSNAYATVSRGYRSGGYNIQMFSDLLQAQMQTAIMHNVANATVPVIDGVTMIPADVKTKVRDMLVAMGTAETANVEAVTWYKPEVSWNYELGTHLNLCANRLQADASLFYMDTRDQQLSMMSAGGLGRVTVNSGRSRSLGGEAALRWRITDGLQAQAAYGYTDARFRDGGYVPFVPRHTFAVGATQTWTLKSPRHDIISLHADYRGAGRIYWTEANTAWQNFAGTLNARLAYEMHGTATMEVALYAHNVLGTRYQTFYFETMQRAFAQYTRPAELGVQLRWRLK